MSTVKRSILCVDNDTNICSLHFLTFMASLSVFYIFEESLLDNLRNVKWSYWCAITPNGTLILLKRKDFHEQSPINQKKLILVTCYKLKSLSSYALPVRSQNKSQLYFYIFINNHYLLLFFLFQHLLTFHTS